MKISDILSQQAVEANKGIGKQTGPKADSTFAALLESEISDSLELDSDQVSDVNGLTDIAGITQPKKSGGAGLSQNVSDISDVISKLDSLGQALKSDASPKQVDALLSDLNADATQLQDKLSGLPEDHPLKAIGDEINVAAYMESIKFKRGDYL